MPKKDDPILTMDRRFLMDFLTDPKTEDEERSYPPISSKKPSEEEIRVYADKYARYSASLEQMFLSTAEDVIPYLTCSEFDQWALAGFDLMDAIPTQSACVFDFFKSSPMILEAGSFAYFKGWIQQGFKIAASSPMAAAAFYRLTPLFIERCDIIHIHRWGGWGVEIINRIRDGEDTAILFYENSIDHLQFMSIRELKDWKALGLLFAKNSKKLGDIFFSNTI